MVLNRLLQTHVVLLLVLLQSCKHVYYVYHNNYAFTVFTLNFCTCADTEGMWGPDPPQSLKITKI